MSLKHRYVPFGVVFVHRKTQRKFPSLYEAKRTNIRNHTRRNYTAKLHQTTMKNTVKYMLRYATLRVDTKKVHTKFYYN